MLLDAVANSPFGTFEYQAKTLKVAAKMVQRKDGSNMYSLQIIPEEYITGQTKYVLRGMEQNEK